RTGCGHQLPPHLAATPHRCQVAGLLLWRAVRDERGPGHADALGEDAGGDVDLGLLLSEDHLLHRRAATTAVFLRPGDAGPAVLEQSRLPLLGPPDLEGLRL